MLSRKLLLIALFTCLGMLRLVAQNSIHVHGTITDSDGNLIPDINVIISAVYSDSTVIFESLSSGPNGDYAVDIAGPGPNVTGTVDVNMVNCFGVFVTQTFTVGNGLNDIQADFVYCENVVLDSCAVYIVEESNPGTINNLTAYTYTNAQVYYAWSTGDSTQTIYPTIPGEYCVQVFFPWGCVGTDCYTYLPDTTSACFGYIGYTPVSNGTYILQAYDFGTPPFTYLWSTGATTSAIDSIYPGTYCVTITDADSCVYSTCTVINQVCYAWIYGDPATGLTAASSGVPPFTYQWSTGATTPTIFPTIPGLYCVTVVDGLGCDASSCYNVYNNYDSCYVNVIPIYIDSNTIALEASTNFFGQAGTYVWNTGDSTQIIYPSDPSFNYCVTVTSPNGCIATGCFQNSQLCYSWVDVVYLDTVTAELTVHADPIFGWPGSNTEDYAWSTGDSTETITVHANGEYCVTSTLGAGCVTEACGYVDFDSLQLSCYTYVYQFQDTASQQWYAAASSWGYGTFSYLWANGDTNLVTPIDGPNAYMCVTATSSFGCTSVACTDTFFNPCQVYIYIDYLGSSAILSAISYYGGALNLGTFTWSNGQQGDSITVINDGTYCVTFNSSNGCSSQTCVDIYLNPNVDSCGVYISLEPNPLGITYYANTWGVPPFTYLWSNGSTDVYQTFDIPTPGICVTVTDAVGCVSSNCVPFDTLNGSNIINGYVFADSLSQLASQVYAYAYDPNSGEPFVAVDSTLTGDYGFYQFNELPSGLYLIKARLVPGAVGSEQYLPTYHLTSSTWENANPVVLPNWLQITTDIYMQHVIGNPGNGGIGGVVLDPHHIVANAGSAVRDLVGLANVEVILKNEAGDPIGFAYSDGDGNFRFFNLGFGTYRISYDIPGIHSPDVWVTLTPEDPERLQITLIVNQGTTSVDQPVAKEVSLYPNPAKNEVNIRIPESKGYYRIQIVDMQGRIVYTGSASSINGILPIEVGQLSSGLFHINLKGENQSYYSRFLKLE